MERTKVIYDNYVLFENGVVLSLITNQFLKDWVSNGYICININGNIHKLHRLLAKAFIANPDGFDCVDHIDHNRSNNDLLNLRWCNSAQNNQNQSKRKDNTTGEIGIYKYISKKSNGNTYIYWRVVVECVGKKSLIKQYPCNKSDVDIPDYVKKTRDEFKRQLHGEFASF